MLPAVTTACSTPVPASQSNGPRIKTGRSPNAVVDQLRSIDKRRIRHRYGQIRLEKLHAMDSVCACTWGWCLKT